MAAASSFHRVPISSASDTSPSSHPNAPNIELGIAGDGAIETNAPRRGKLNAGQQYSVLFSNSLCGSVILSVGQRYSVQLGFLKKHGKWQTVTFRIPHKNLVSYLTLAGCATSDKTLDPSVPLFSSDNRSSRNSYFTKPSEDSNNIILAAVLGM